MNAPLRKSLVLLAILSLGAFHRSAIARTFTDTKGRTIEAKLVAFTGGDKIVIERGGSEFTVPVAMFSSEDQEYIKLWKKEHPTAEKVDADFRYFVTLERAKGDTEFADKVNRDERLQTQNWTYDFSITNNGDTDLADLRIAYQILVEDIVDKNGNYRMMSVTNAKADMKVERILEEAKVDVLPVKKRADIVKTFALEKYVDRDGGKVAVSAQDKVIGLWIRIYKGDTMLAEYQKAASGMSLKNIRWDKNDKGSAKVQIR